MFNILVIEDNKNMRKLICATLKQNGYSTFEAEDGEVGLDVLDTTHIDLIICDIMMPNMDGYEFTETLRDGHCEIPIIIVTAKEQLEDKKKGFSIGADDYICKPFRPRELLARINTVLRRKNGKSEFLSCKDITVDVQKAVVRKGNTELFLSALEYRLLLVFLQNPGVVFSRKKLLEMIWDVTGDFISDNTLTVYMKRLRDKIETNPQEPEILLTVRGLGYKAGE